MARRRRRSSSRRRPLTRREPPNVARLRKLCKGAKMYGHNGSKSPAYCNPKKDGVRAYISLRGKVFTAKCGASKVFHSSYKRDVMEWSRKMRARGMKCSVTAAGSIGGKAKQERTKRRYYGRRRASAETVAARAEYRRRMYGDQPLTPGMRRAITYNAGRVAPWTW